MTEIIGTAGKGSFRVLHCGPRGVCTVVQVLVEPLAAPTAQSASTPYKMCEHLRRTRKHAVTAPSVALALTMFNELVLVNCEI